MISKILNTIADFCDCALEFIADFIIPLMLVAVFVLLIVMLVATCIAAMNGDLQPTSGNYPTPILMPIRV